MQVYGVWCSLRFELQFFHLNITPVLILLYTHIMQVYVFLTFFCSFNWLFFSPKPLLLFCFFLQFYIHKVSVNRKKKHCNDCMPRRFSGRGDFKATKCFFFSFLFFFAWCLNISLKNTSSAILWVCQISKCVRRRGPKNILCPVYSIHLIRPCFWWHIKDLWHIISAIISRTMILRGRLQIKQTACPY